MMNISFYLNNAQLPSVSWQGVMRGNPGVGGSEYEIVLLACALSKRHAHNVTIYAHNVENFPEYLHVEEVADLYEAIQKSSRKNFDYLIFKQDPLWIERKYFENVPHNLGLILWCHNFLTSTQMDYYSGLPAVKSVICVGREQVDLYRDHQLFSKMDYIYNGFPISKHPSTGIEPLDRRKNIVTYVGSLVPSKGFQILAKAWKTILASVPDAQLYVIGSGKVYDDNKLLGEYGIADARFEQEFMPYLLDEKGEIMPSVHFMGRMGTEKSEIIKQTKVGVPNPSGDTETFGIGAVEFEIMGCKVVTRRCCGYLDTVYNRDNLYGPRRAKCLAKHVIKALKEPVKDDYTLVYQFIQDKFSIEQTVVEWEHLFEALKNNQCRIHNLDKDIPNKTYRGKWFRIIYAKINRLIGYRLPCTTRLEESRIIRKIRCINNKLY